MLDPGSTKKTWSKFFTGVWRFINRDTVKGILVGGLIGVVISIVAFYFLEATTKNLANVFVVFIVVIAFFYSGFHLLTSWSSATEKASISAQIFTVSIASLMGLVVLGTNREDARCLRLLTDKNGITELLSEITYQVRDKIGVPENCFNSKGGTIPMQATDEGIRNHREYATNVTLLNERINRFPARNQAVMESFSKYTDARFQLESQCGARNEEFGKFYHAVRPAELDLTNQLNVSVSSCLGL